jgi:alpha-tubulin suppressor-like RCC1 family protein
VVLAGGGLKCFGYGSHGRLGYGDTQNRGDKPGDLNDFVPIKEQILQVSAGDDHTCVLLEGGRLKCFGLGSGRLGYGDTQNRGDKPDSLNEFVPIGVKAQIP